MTTKPNAALMPKLHEPCPFCKGWNLTIITKDNGYEHYVECECGARGTEWDFDNWPVDYQKIADGWDNDLRTPASEPELVEAVANEIQESLAGQDVCEETCKTAAQNVIAITRDAIEGPLKAEFARLREDIQGMKADEAELRRVAWENPQDLRDFVRLNYPRTTPQASERGGE